MRWPLLLAALALVGLALACGDEEEAGTPKPTAQATASPAAIREHSLGSATAPVTLVEYADFQCPYCRDFARGAEQDIIREYVDTGKVRLVFRQFPIIGNESWLAADATECAADQGKFWEYNHLLFEKWEGENVGTYRPDKLKSYAQELGLDSQQFTACLDRGQHRASVEAAKAMGVAQGVKGTPSFFVNGKQAQLRSLSFDAFRPIIEDALQR